VKKTGFVIGEVAMNESTALPPQFVSLETFVSEWAQKNEADRLHKLQRSSIPQLKEFFDAMYPLAEEIKSYLWGKKLDALSDEDKRLFFLLMTFVETAHPVELNWATTDESASSNKFEIAHISPIPD
jgi:hypothetical protein